jgi:hypothetical protein
MSETALILLDGSVGSIRQDGRPLAEIIWNDSMLFEKRDGEFKRVQNDRQHRAILMTTYYGYQYYREVGDEKELYNMQKIKRR